MTASPQILWAAPDDFPELRSLEIHLWCAWLGEPDGRDPAAEGCLSADELARAASFRFAVDRHRFVASRRNLRHVLAAYSGRDPASLVFHYGRFGKPMLAHRADATGPFHPTLNSLCFNQSHSGDLWLLAVAWNQPLGVDLEAVKDLPDLPLLEAKLFAPEELEQQQALAKADRLLGFYERWTRREATTKFQGLGFEPTARYAATDQGELLHPAEGHLGFLAYGGARVGIRQYCWKPSLRRAVPVNPPPAIAALP